MSPDIFRPRPETDQEASQTLGLVRIGTVDLAIPAGLIQEVVLGPISISALPHAPHHVLGAFALGGQPVPVIDLAPLIRPAAAALARPVDYALVIHHAGGRFAIQVDEVIGFFPAPPETITELTALQDKGLFSQVHTCAKTGRVAALLEIETVLALEGVRSAVNPERAAAAAAMALPEHRAPLVLFRVGNACLGIDAAIVQHVIARPAQIDSPLENPVMQGFQFFRGSAWPVIDPARLLELPVSNAAQTRHLLFCEGDRPAGFDIDELIGIDRQPPASFSEVPGGATGEISRFAGSYVHRDHGLVLVLDMARLLADFPAMETRHLASAAPIDNSAERRYLIYQCGGAMFATSLEELEAVAPLPTNRIAAGDQGEEIASHAGQPITLIDLAAQLGLATLVSPSSVLLCVRSKDGLSGFIVDRAVMLRSVRPQPLAAHLSSRRPGLPQISEVISVRENDRPRTACVLSLRQLRAESDSADVNLATTGQQL